MTKLLNRSLKRILIYAGLVLAFSIPVYYIIISRLWQYELEEHNIILTSEAGREDSYMIIGAVTLVSILFFILLMLGFVLLNRRISTRLWRPFYHSLGQIRNFDLNQQKDILFEKTDITEFAELNQSLHKLIAGNIAIYNQQKEFADNASHELQTPLAIVQSKLDLFLQSKSLTDDQYNIIEDALKALGRVSRINKNLLLLTKMENSQFMEKELINFSDLLNDTIVLFIPFVEGKQLALHKNIVPDVVIDGNKILIEILFNNLITNAIRYSFAGGIISVKLTEKSLVISNAGTLALSQERLFKRFSAASSQTPGTGLGLALVKQICSRYNWNVQYTFDNGLHIFSIVF